MKQVNSVLRFTVVLLLLFGVFAGPMTFAWVYYYAETLKTPGELADRIAIAQNIESVSKWCLAIGFVGLISILLTKFGLLDRLK